jgi:hypothetical protein
MITADKRKAIFLLHQEGVSKRAIARQLRLSRNAVRRIIAQSGQMPPPIRPPKAVLDLRHRQHQPGSLVWPGWYGLGAHAVMVPEMEAFVPS